MLHFCCKCEKAYNAVFRCTYKQGIHKTICKLQVSICGNELHTKNSHTAKYRVQKNKTHCFWYLKRTKTDTQLFFSDTLSMKTTKLVASSGFSLKSIDFIPKSTIQAFTVCQKVQSAVFGTYQVQVAKKKNALLLVPKRDQTQIHSCFSLTL